TPLIRAGARALVRWRPDVDRRLYAWQVGKFIQDPEVRSELVPQLYEQFLHARPAFWRLNNDLLGTVLTRRRRIPPLRPSGKGDLRVARPVSHPSGRQTIRGTVLQQPIASPRRRRPLRPGRPAGEGRQPHTERVGRRPQ